MDVPLCQHLPDVCASGNSKASLGQDLSLLSQQTGRLTVQNLLLQFIPDQTSTVSPYAYV